jgi:hypothetical protein
MASWEPAFSALKLMWVRDHHCDDEKKLVFGTLDNEPVNDYDGSVELGSQLAVDSRAQEADGVRKTELKLLF